MYSINSEDSCRMLYPRVTRTNVSVLHHRVDDDDVWCTDGILNAAYHDRSLKQDQARLPGRLHCPQTYNDGSCTSEWKNTFRLLRQMFYMMDELSQSCVNSFEGYIMYKLHVVRKY